MVTCSSRSHSQGHNYSCILGGGEGGPHMTKNRISGVNDDCMWSDTDITDSKVLD